MVFDITYSEKAVIEEVNQLVGEPYSFFQRLKLGGIGSERVQIMKSSPKVAHHLQHDISINYCNLELRPKGLIIHLKYKLKDLAWVIPWGMSSLFSSVHGLKIYGGADYVVLQKMYRGSNLDKFTKKMMKARATYLDETNPFS